MPWPPEAVVSVAAAVETPALVFDEAVIVRALERAAELRAHCGCKVLYAVKALCCPFVLELMRPWLDGFATSSLFESRLARSVLGDAGLVHITTPGFRPAEIEELGALCDRISFNSLGQLSRFGSRIGSAAKVGLRVNPRFPLVADVRYNPCRPASKLGVPLDRLLRHRARSPSNQVRLHGLHFHTNCGSDDWGPLLGTVRHIEAKLRHQLAELEWINLGGGYLLDPGARTDPLIEAVERLRRRQDVEVVIEPGAAFVREAGALVCEVIDLFRSGGKTVAVLDTTVNHVPEVFEYQFEPDVLGHDDGAYEYQLAGSTCLAGDLMGEYAFAEPLRLGSRVVLLNVGAYALVKAHMFNGVNLPSIYSVRSGGQLVLHRRFDYRDFLARTGAPDDAAA
jgi:carboxynorspermidine decarboxylase